MFKEHTSNPSNLQKPKPLNYFRNSNHNNTDIHTNRKMLKHTKHTQRLILLENIEIYNAYNETDSFAKQ